MPHRKDLKVGGYFISLHTCEDFKLHLEHKGHELDQLLRSKRGSGKHSLIYWAGDDLALMLYL